MPDTPRQLGLLSAAALVVANMVGTGVFTTSGFLLRDLHSPGIVLVAWMAGGLLAALGAVSYGALARRIPESGGEYRFLSRTVHPAAGYLAGWVSLLVGFSAPVAAAAFGFGAYAKAWAPGVPPQALGTLLVLACAGLHATQVRRGARVQDAAVVVKLLIIVGFVGLAATRLRDVPAAAVEAPPVTAFAVALVWVSFSYSGWNAAVYVGGEVRDPEHTLPRALLLGTGIVTVLYLGLNAVFLFAAPAEELAGKVDVGRVAAAALGGAVWANAVTVAILLALATTVSAMVMAGPRVYAQMAADGYLPRALRQASGPPRAAIALQTALALALLWSATFDALLTYIGFTLGLSAAGTVAGLMLLRRREGPGAVPVPGWPWVPGLYVLAVLAITGFTIVGRPRESAAGLATLVVGYGAWHVHERMRRA